MLFLANVSGVSSDDSHIVTDTVHNSAPGTHSIFGLARFRMTNLDLPRDLKLSGKPGDDVQSVMTQFRTRVALISEDTTAPDIIDRRAVRYLDLLVTDAALIAK